MDNYKNIGKRIKNERNTLKLTQKELAQRAGIDFRFLGNIERGISKPSLDTFVKIAQALDIPLDILVAKTVLHQNPPQNSSITKEIVRLISMLDEFDALRVLQLVRYSIELFTGKKVSIPNEIQSNLKDDRVASNKEYVQPRKKSYKGLTKFWEQENISNKKDNLLNSKKNKLKSKKTSKKIWLV